MSSSNSDLIQIRLKLKDGKVVGTELDRTSKKVEKLGDTTTRTSSKQAKAQKVTSRLTAAYKSLGTTAKVGFGILAAGAAVAIHKSIADTEELAKTTSGLSRNMGLSTEMASRWGAVAQAREIDSKALGMAMGTLGKHFVEAAHKGGSALTPFHQLGISQEELVAGAHDTESAILIAAKAFGKAEGGPQRQAAAMALLGKGWSTVLPLMSEGSTGLQEQLHWADEYGVTLKGKTNDAIMEMVQAQRENKVAMLGLEVSLTKALLPAIHAGDEQLQTFIQTLNDPKLTDEQKFERIGRQFQGIEAEIVKVIDRSGPEIASHAGELGVHMAGALVHGFINTDALGRLAISVWLVKKMGGVSTLRKVGFFAGGNVGSGFGFGLIAGATGVFVGFELGEALDKVTQGDFRRWGVNAGQNFTNALIAVVNVGIDGINDALDAGNALAVFGVDAPNIGEVGSVNFHSEAERVEEERGVEIPNPAGINPLPPLGTKNHRRKHRSEPKKRPQIQRRANLKSDGGRQQIVIKHQTVLDGKVVAESVAKHAADAKAVS